MFRDDLCHCPFKPPVYSSLLFPDRFLSLQLFFICPPPFSNRFSPHLSPSSCTIYPPSLFQLLFAFSPSPHMAIVTLPGRGPDIYEVYWQGRGTQQEGVVGLYFQASFSLLLSLVLCALTQRFKLKIKWTIRIKNELPPPPLIFVGYCAPVYFCLIGKIAVPSVWDIKILEIPNISP